MLSPYFIPRVQLNVFIEEY